MTPHQAWGDMLSGPVQRRPVLWLTLGAVAGGFASGLVIGWAKAKAQR